MSWLEHCYQTYEYIRRTEPGLIGKQEPKRVPLFPVGHTTQQANLQIELDPDGNFVSARILRPDEYTTIVPCTEESASRTHLNPHALADKLQYLASDYKDFGGPKESGWEAYHKQLAAWCQSEFAHPLVCAVLRYLEKGTLIRDLLSRGCLVADDTGKLPRTYSGSDEETPAIFKSLQSKDQTESFVRFRVGTDDLWTDHSVWDSWLDFYETQLTHIDYCTVLGQKVPISTLSPKKIRNPGDGAKLISSNDSTNFTYRGRFSNAEQALSIGYRTTQEAHNALRWLISKQGTQCGDETILVWGTQNEPVPNLGDDSYDFSQDFQDEEEDDLGVDKLAPAVTATTQEAVAKQFNLAVQGYRMKLTDTSQLSVMILDSATAGRLSVRYYQELSGSRLLENVVDWHETFSWLLEYRVTAEKNPPPDKKPKMIRISFVGAPSPEDIAKAAYGEKVDAKLKQQTLERLVPCIVERKLLPRDLMLSAVHRASNAVALEPWDARKTRSIACALIRGYYLRSKGVTYTMDNTMNDKNTNPRGRDFIFGQILACAEQVERYAQNLTMDDKRTTNAERLQLVFVQHPSRTTMLLQQKLVPYLNRIRAKGGSSKRYDMMLSFIEELGSDFTNKPLNELYLLGYATQLQEFRRENEAYKNSETETTETN